MVSDGIFPFYCHFALLILYHWHCCLHCSCLTALKRIYCAEKFKRELKWDEIQCGSVGQYKFYGVTISGFIKGAECSFFGVFMWGCDCLWPWLVREYVCIRICAGNCAPADECESLVKLSVLTGKYCLVNVWSWLFLYACTSVFMEVWFYVFWHKGVWIQKREWCSVQSACRAAHAHPVQ